jgi:hypothetical protein
MPDFHYSNIQKHGSGSTKKVRKVVIKKEKGYKSISFYKNGKLVKTIKRPLLSTHIQSIKQGIFIPGLFSDCKAKTKTAKNRSNKK